MPTAPTDYRVCGKIFLIVDLHLNVMFMWISICFMSYFVIVKNLYSGRAK
jgi:hypothetical protein